VEEAAADVVFLEHQVDGLALVEGRPARAAALGVGGEGLFELPGRTDAVVFI
jgi:hypothetical protein